jgi:competence protein ComGC
MLPVMSTAKDATSSVLPDAAWQRLGGELPPPASAADQQDVLWQEYQAHFRWYDRAATRTRRVYTILKVISLAVAAAVPVLAAIRAQAALTASLAAVVVIVEGIVQLFQLQTNWISYRASAEALRQHGFFYAAQVDPYNNPQTRRDMLAVFLRDATTKENTAWASSMRQTVPAPRGNP